MAEETCPPHGIQKVERREEAQRGYISQSHARFLARGYLQTVQSANELIKGLVH